MRKSITNVSFMKIGNLEFAHLVMRLEKVVAKHHPADLKIEGVYNLLVGELPKLKVLQVKSAKLPISNELKALRKKRHSLLVVISGKVRLLPKAQVSALNESAAMVVPSLEKYLKNIVSDKLNTQSEKIKELFEELGKDANMDGALAALGLKAYLDELKALQVAIEKTSESRVEIKSINRQNLDARVVKSEITQSVSDLLNYIEVAQKENKTIDYTPLVNELNALLIPYQAELKSRNTRTKNATLAAEKKESNNTSTMDSVAV